MEVIITPDHALHAPPHEFYDGALIPMFELPRRAEIIERALRAAGLALGAPRSFGTAPLLRVHTPPYLSYLEHAYDRWVAAGGAPEAVLPSTFPLRWMHGSSQSPLAEAGYYTFDLSAPIVAGTYAVARSAADAALTGAALLGEGHGAAYALCRPPGHHAGTDMCGGYCFLNNAAIAAQALRDAGRERVAILDIDIHHGNGTQQIFYERGDVLVISLHGDPAIIYPYYTGYDGERGAGAGLGFNRNIPLPPGTDDAAYLAALRPALAELAAFAPGALVVSAGFDTFMGDPVVEGGGGFALTAAAYPQIGAVIAALALPTLFVQEGGYAIDPLGANVVGLLRGFDAG